MNDFDEFFQAMRAILAVVRHEQVERVIRTALPTVEGVRVDLETFVPVFGRSDIMLLGSPLSGNQNQDIDKIHGQPHCS
jgi:hypothetical protein